jgi:large repetitive protein
MNLSSVLGSIRRKTLAAPAVRRPRQRPRLDVQTLEAREVPAVLPPPVIDPFSYKIAQDPNVNGAGGFPVINGDGTLTAFAPAVAANPNNPFQLFEAHVLYTNAGRTTTRVVIQYSNNGGETWGFADFPALDADFKASPDFANAVPFTNVSNPSVAFDTFGNAYVAYTETNTDHSAGRLILRKYSFNNGVPPAEQDISNNSANGTDGLFGTGLEHVLYKWANGDEAYNPVVAIDTNRITAQTTDTQPNGSTVSQTDALANKQTTAAEVRVFVAWNTRNLDPNPRPTGFNPNVIKMALSDDGGGHFGPPVLMNNDLNFNNEAAGSPEHYSQPQIVFTQGRAGVANSGGVMVTAWTDFNVAPVTPSIIADSHSFTATNVPETVEVTNTASMAIIDAINPGSDPHQPQQTLYPINVTAANLGGLTRINNLSVSINLHHDDLSQLRIELVAPSGQAVTLLNNGVNSSGTTIPNTGITGTDLGLVNVDLNRPFSGWNVGTVFQDNAARSIRDGTAPRTGTFRPEAGSLNTTFGAAGVTLQGTWILRITDMRNSGSPTPATYVRQVTLKFTQNYRDAQDPDNLTGYAVNRGTFTGTGFPTASAASAVGVGPGVSLATDATIGAYSPYQNRVYLSYVLNGNVRLIFSDDGGVTWSSTSANLGSGFLPKLAVDQTTGTLAVAYYSTSFAATGAPVTGDAAGVRAATIFRTAINLPNFKPSGTPTGSIEFSPVTFVNPVEQYQDQITSTKKTFEPITSNGAVANMGPEGYGNNMGLVIYNGKVSLLYAGNLNEQGGFIRTQDMTIAAGPRVVFGDTGPVLNDAQVTKALTNPNLPFPANDTTASGIITYNNTFASDGTRQFTGFVVTFDRIIDPATFTPDDITIKFRSPTDDPINGGTDIPTTDYTIIPLDSLTDTVNDGTVAVPYFSPYGSKRFLVRMNPGKELSAVGTYSYSIGGDISDRIRNRDFKFVNAGSPLAPITRTEAPPLVIPDAVGGNPGAPAVSTLSVNIPGAPAPVIGKVAVTVNITHTDISNLQLTLISPAGVRITLARSGDSGAGANYTNTIFDDDGALTLASDLPPHSDPGRYRPFESLQQLRQAPTNGNWKLEVIDNVAGDQGVINNWSLTFTTATLVTTNSPGNKHDQDSDGVEGELDQDQFAMPNPVANTPFALPYVSGSLPIIIPGPHVLNTRPTGQAPSTDNLVKNTTANSFDVEFDRVMDSSTFTPADIIRITGPLGDIPLTGVGVAPISGLNGSVLANPLTNSRFFRITFAKQSLSGYYQIQLGSHVKDTFGNEMDSNLNAGVGNLSGGAVGAPVVLTTFDKGSFSTPLVAGTTTTIPLDVDQAFLIQRATVNLSVALQAGGNMRNIDIQLIAPDGTAVLLATNAPASGSAASMTNTTFDDAATTPVQLGGTFDNASFNPVQPLAQLIGHGTTFGSNKTWKLVIKNKGTVNGTASGFVLKFDKSKAGTGLGEEVADQTSLSFRIFQTDGSSTTARGNWTPLGPAGEGTQSTAGRVQAVAVDPSDPSGNTVYAAGASGGVWRTTNFMTADVDGPTWVPLTDFGPTNGINVGALSLFPDPNGNPQLTTVLVGTGSQDADRIETADMNGQEKLRFDGVGFLMSEDAGKTWQVLDSLNNYDTTTNKYRPISDPARDHRFVGTVVNRIVYENNKNAFAPFRPIAYAVIGQGTSTIANVAGLYRSLDGGRTWAQLFAGTVDDFQVAQGSSLPNSGNRPTIAYMSVEGDGMYRTVNLNSTLPAFTKMLGGVQRPTIDSENGTGGAKVAAPPSDPNGGKSKIVVAVPFFSTKVVTDPNTGTPTVVQADPLANNYYQSWVYAAVTNADGTFDGLYQSKDAGDNWTRIFAPKPTDPPYFVTDHGGQHSLALAVDPTNPNIVYLGSDTLFRIDATFSNDAYNLSMYQHSNNDGGLIRPLTVGSTQVAQTRWDNGIEKAGDGEFGSGLNAADPFNLDPFGLPLDSFSPLTYFQETDSVLQSDPRKVWNFLNLKRDPYNPFRTDTPLSTFNGDIFESGFTLGTFTNTGADVTVLGVVEGARDFNWLSNIVTFVDPLTGKGRIVYGMDEGIATDVIESNGSLNRVNTFFQPPLNGPAGVPETVLSAGTNGQRLYDTGGVTNGSVANSNIQINGRRNGNLQVAQFYSGDVQPSLLAASISQSLALGGARRLEDVAASSDGILGTGENVWGSTGRNGRANYVMTDQTGTGAIYILNRGQESLDPRVPLPALPINTANFFQVSLQGLPPISRTQGLFDRGFAQWTNSVRRFAVNPIDPNGIIIGSALGNLYRTTDQGLNWFLIGDAQNLSGQGVLDGRYTTAMAFGAPETNTTALNDHIYVGTEGGKIFVTNTGGGTNAGGQVNWQDISAGIGAGEIIEKIVPNPTRGTHEAYAVTDKGVYWMADWTVAGATWQNLTNNVKTIQHLAFGSADWSENLVGQGVQTPQLMTIAVDWRPTYSPTPGLPILYVGGDAGVFRALRNTTDPTQTTWVRYTGVTANGASSDGGGLPVVKVVDLDLATGNIDPNSGRVLSAGSPDLLVATTLGRGTWTVALGKPAGVSGPKVISATPNTPQVNPVDKVTITFDQYIDPTSFDVSDVKVTDPNGNPVTVQAVVDVTNPPAGDANLHNVWDIVFDTDPINPPDTRLAAEGTYTIVVGPGVQDGGGTPMDQNGNGVPDGAADAFKMTLVVGKNDVTDFILDSYLKLLGRLTTTAEYTATTAAAVDTARFTALQTVVKELLSTYNPTAGQPSEARQRLVERLFNIANPAEAAVETGNLLVNTGPNPYTLTAAERDALVADLKAGRKSPESIMVYIMTKPEYFAQAGGTVGGFLNKVYADLFKGTTVAFNRLAPSVQSSQTTQAQTATGRANLVRSLINGANVTYDHDNNPSTAMITTNYRSNQVNLVYQQLLGRPATSAEITAGKSLLAKPLAANSLQGTEWLYWKVLTSKEFFSNQIQNEPGVSPDDGLHTDRSWVNGVIATRFFRGAADPDGDGFPSQITERDVYSQKILDLFKTQRASLEKSLINGNEYRTARIKQYFVLVLGRQPTDQEVTTWLTNMKNGKTLTNLVSSLLGTAEYFNAHTTPTATASVKNHEWAKAVYQTLLGRLPTTTEENALVSRIATLGRAGATVAVLNSQDHTNGETWFDKGVIKPAFNLLLGRLPSAAELTAYENFLKTNRWENVLVDIMANGAAIVESPTLPRDFWEVNN